MKKNFQNLDSSRINKNRIYIQNEKPPKLDHQTGMPYDNQEGSVQFEVEDESKPKEAWTIGISLVPMLAVIGRFF